MNEMKKQKERTRSRSRDKKPDKINQSPQTFISDTLNYLPSVDNFNLNMNNMIPFQTTLYNGVQITPQNQMKIFNSLSFNSNSNDKEGDKVNPQRQFPYKHARRLYVGNIPEQLTKQQLSKWLYSCLKVSGGIIGQGNPITSIMIDFRGRFAFIELRSIEETTAAFSLDGIFLVMSSNQWNKQLRIRRPTEYGKYPKIEGTRQVPKLNLSILQQNGLQIIPTQVQNGPLKMYLANLPVGMDEHTLIESLQLKKFGYL